MCGASIKNQRQREKKVACTPCVNGTISRDKSAPSIHTHTPSCTRRPLVEQQARWARTKIKQITPRVRGTRTAAESPPPHPTPLFLVGFAVPPHSSMVCDIHLFDFAPEMALLLLALLLPAGTGAFVSLLGAGPERCDSLVLAARFDNMCNVCIN